MGILEIIAEQELGPKAWRNHPQLRAAFGEIEQLVRVRELLPHEKARIASLVELCCAYDREQDTDEKANILRTLEEISENSTLELPQETLEEWEHSLEDDSPGFAAASRKAATRREHFLKKYFS